MLVNRKLEQKILLKHQLMSAVVALEGAYSNALTSEEVREVLDSFSGGKDEDLAALLDAMHAYFVSTKNP